VEPTLGLLLAPLALGIVLSGALAWREREARALVAIALLPLLGLRYLRYSWPAHASWLESLRDGSGEAFAIDLAINVLAAVVVVFFVRSLLERNRAEQVQWESMEAVRALVSFFAHSRGPFERRVEQLLQIGLRSLDAEVAVVLRLEEERLFVIASCGPDLPRAGEQMKRTDGPFERAALAEGPLGFENLPETFGARHPCVAELGIRHVFAAPVAVRGDLYGVLAFGTRRKRFARATPIRRELLSLMANWIGEELARRKIDRGHGGLARQQATTLEFSRALGRPRESGLSSQIVEGVQRTLGVSGVALLGRRAGESSLRVEAAAGLEEDLQVGTRLEAREGLLASTIGGGDIIALDDIGAGPGLGLPEAFAAAASAAIVPVEAPSGSAEFRGALLVLGSVRRHFAPEELDFLRVTANLLSAAQASPPSRSADSRAGDADDAAGSTRSGRKQLVPRRNDEADRRRLDVDRSLEHLEPELRAALAPERGLELVTGLGECAAPLYRYEFDRIVWSLVAHAVALSGAGSSVRIASAAITAEAGSGTSDFLTIEIATRGPRAEAEFTETLLRDGAQGPGLPGAPASSRLGITRIERLLADAGGDLSIHRDPEAGTRFSAFLPVLAPTRLEPGAARESQGR